MRNSELMRSGANVPALDSGRMESDLQAVEGISPAGRIIIQEKEKGGSAALVSLVSFPGR